MATDYATREAAYLARKEQLHATAPYVCALLGEGWTVGPVKEAVVGDHLPNHVDLNGPDGAQLSLSAGYAYDPKGSVTGYLNDMLNGYKFWYLPHGVNRPSIGVNIARGAKAIANEIKRRVLPDYLLLLAACNAARVAHEYHVASAYATATQVAGVIEAPIREDREAGGGTVKIHAYGSKALAGATLDIKVAGAFNSDTYKREPEVTFDRLTVSPKVACEILAILARNHKTEE